MAVPVWTPPSPFAVGHLETADELNAIFVDNMSFLHAARYARAYRATSAQSIPNTTVTAISFNAETADPWALHDNSTNPSRHTCPAQLAGIWRVRGQAEFAANATGFRSIYIYRNGVEVCHKDRDAAASGVTFADIEGTVVMSSTDYVEVMVKQTSGGALNVDFGSTLTFVEVEHVGAAVS